MKRMTISVALAVALFVAVHARGQTPAPAEFTCSPAPCVLPPTQASEGGRIVTDPLIATDPLNQKELLLGSFDDNCYSSGALGFHLSRDGGSTWTRYCMPWTYEPHVGYDRHGTAYAAGGYCNDYGDHCVLAVKSSKDGGHWSKSAIALRRPGLTYPFETSLTVDTNPGSPRVNSVYVSGIMWLNQGVDNQVLVSHSTDGGVSWKQVAVDQVQTYPAEDRYTRTAVGKDGAVYVSWLHCPAAGTDESCSDGAAHVMLSRSTDGGNTWSAPRLITRAQYAPSPLPNTSPSVGVDDYPVIAVDDSGGPYAGNLYVAMFTWTGTHLQVQVSRSTDDGVTWSGPVPLASLDATHDQFFPAISVSPTGRVGVSWLDRRNDPGDLNYQAFAAFSDDGGQHFGANWQLTTAFSNPDTNGDYNWMGDYTGNTWRGDNTFIAAWMDSSNGVDMQEVVGGVRLK